MAQANENVLQFSKRGGDVGSRKPPGPPLLPPGGGDGMSDLEVRVAVLEADLGNIKTNIVDIKSDIKDVRSEIKALSEKLSAGVIWILGVGGGIVLLGISATVGLAYLMAKGFKWL